MFSYVSAIRHGTNEQKALKELRSELQGSATKSQTHVDNVTPLIEIVEEDHLQITGQYTSKFDEVFIDFPRYLLDRDNKHQPEIQNLVSKFSNSPANFHLQNPNPETTPVISGRLDPIDHSNFGQYIKRLFRDHDRICVRIFVPIDPYNSSEKREIKQIIDLLRPEDAILMDVPDVDKLSTGIRPNLEFVEDKTGSQDLYVFDVFEPTESSNHNYSLVTAKLLDADGTGDFVLEPRFPEDIPGAAFQNIPRRIRQYEASLHSVRTWEDSDHYVNAVREMIRNGNLNQSHCPFCQQLYDEYQTVQSDPSRKDIGSSFVKRMRMNHYQYSLLSDEYPNMTSAPTAKDFDQKGYGDIV